MKEIAEIVECPVCQELPKDCSFVQCTNGHIGCYSCFSRLQLCPVCRIEMNKKAKMISIDKLSEMLSELRHVETRLMLLQNEKVTEFFKCLLCKFVPTSKPIFQCVDGHLFCEGCAPRRCWKHEHMTDANFRSLYCEKILSRVDKQCRFARHGCKEVIKECNKHEQDCIYKEIRCVFPSCFKSDNILSNLLDHLQKQTDEHKNFSNFLLNMDDVQMNRGHFYLPHVTDGVMVPPQKILYTNHVLFLKLSEKHYFFMQCHVSFAFKDLRFFMHYNGFRKDAEKFKFKLKLYRDGCNSVVHVTGPVVSVEINFLHAIHFQYAYKISFDEIIKKWHKEEQKLAISWEASVYKKNSEV